MGIDATQRKVMGEAVYEELISSILKITNKLDLTSNRASELNVEQVSDVKFDFSLELHLSMVKQVYYI